MTQPDGEHRSGDTDPVRRWDDNLSTLWLDLQSGSFSATQLAVPVGVFALLFLGILLWPGAGLGASDAATYALIFTGVLFGLLMVGVLLASLLWSAVAGVVSLVRLLRRR